MPWFAGGAKRTYQTKDAIYEHEIQNDAKHERRKNIIFNAWPDTTKPKTQFFDFKTVQYIYSASIVQNDFYNVVTF